MANDKELWALEERFWTGGADSARALTAKGAVAVVAYRVSAEREGAPIYEALCASTYLNDNGNWLRMSHQQTPI